jgi:hypothetical protein
MLLLTICSLGAYNHSLGAYNYLLGAYNYSLGAYNYSLGAYNHSFKNIALVDLKLFMCNVCKLVWNLM